MIDTQCSPIIFLASLPALLGFCGFIVYQILGSHGRGEPITQKIIDKLRREAPGAVKPHQRLAPAQVERLLKGNSASRASSGSRTSCCCSRPLSNKFVISIVVYVVLVLLCGLSAFLFARQMQEGKVLRIDGMSLADTNESAGQHLVDLDPLKAFWHVSGEGEDLQASVENVQTGRRSDSLTVPSAQGYVTFDPASYRPVLAERSRGGKNRIRLVLQAKKASFKSDVKDIKVGMTVLTVLDGDARLDVAAMIDNSRISFYDFEAKIVVPPRSSALPYFTVGPQIPYQFRPIKVRNAAAYDWPQAKGAYFGPDDPSLVRFQFLIAH